MFFCFQTVLLILLTSMAHTFNLQIFLIFICHVYTYACCFEQNYDPPHAIIASKKYITHCVVVSKTDCLFLFKPS